MIEPLVVEEEPLGDFTEDVLEEDGVPLLPDEDALPLREDAAGDQEPRVRQRHYARRPKLSVGDVFHRFEAPFRQQHGKRLTVPEDRVLRELMACRTSAMGTHLWQCDHCGAEVELYNSCDNRHCPTCQEERRRQWAEQIQATLLPIEYFHLIATTPRPLAWFAQVNAAVVYPIVLVAGPEALIRFARSRDGIRAQLGVLAILHTWNCSLRMHVHSHLLVSAGGLSLDGKRWIALPPGEFLPLNPIADRYRNLVIRRLRKAYADGKLVFPDTWQRIAQPEAFERWITRLSKIRWKIRNRSVWHRYGPQDTEAAAKTVNYLARYANRVAISNSRLVAIDGEDVIYGYKDYRDGDRWKTNTLDGVEFIRRFLLHVLPKNFHHIRRFGFLGPRVGATLLPRLRELLGVKTPEPDDPPCEDAQRPEDDRPDLSRPCRYCGLGRMHLIAETLRPSVAEIMQMPTPLGILAAERPMQMRLPFTAFT